MYNSFQSLHAEVWNCPSRLGKDVIGAARNSRYLIKHSRKTYRSSRPKIRDAINEARWAIYKPILPPLLGVQPYSTLNAGPVTFGYIQIESCPLTAAKIGIQRGVHPDALFAGKGGIERIRRMAKEGDTIIFFNGAYPDNEAIVTQDIEALDTFTETVLPT
jgi:hypothetical protein